MREETGNENLFLDGLIGSKRIIHNPELSNGCHSQFLLRETILHELYIRKGFNTPSWSPLIPLFVVLGSYRTFESSNGCQNQFPHAQKP